MNILIVSDAPLDESEIGYKAQTIAKEFLKSEHTVTVISFEYQKNDTHPFNAENILFNSSSIAFEIPVYDKCSYSNTLYHNLSNENNKTLREALETKLNEITNKYRFDAIVFFHLIPFLLLKKIPHIPVFVMAEIDESNLLNEAGFPDYIKTDKRNFTLIYSDGYSKDVLNVLIPPNSRDSFPWFAYYNRSIFRYHEENFNEILEKYDFPAGINIILPPMNFTRKEEKIFFNTAKLFFIFRQNINFIVFSEEERKENEELPSNLHIVKPENRFHLSVLYNNSSLALIPSERPFPPNHLFNLAASGVKILTKHYKYMDEIRIPHMNFVTELDLMSVIKEIFSLLDGENFSSNELKEIKKYSFQNRFDDFLDIIKKKSHEYRTDN